AMPVAIISWVVRSISLIARSFFADASQALLQGFQPLLHFSKLLFGVSGPVLQRRQRLHLLALGGDAVFQVIDLLFQLWTGRRLGRNNTAAAIKETVLR